MGLIQAEKRLIFNPQFTGGSQVAFIHEKAVYHIHACLLLSTKCWQAGETAHPRLRLIPLMIDPRVSQMQPAVERQEGRGSDCQVWAPAAILKGDWSPARSGQLGRHLHSCLGKSS